ncbi:MAG: hypothetical protein DMG46_24315 [Acidobacteria bacterium]|nr:MAG: hypothetical protein DMG46_24315 [Acidobacteriota bacterium]
MKGWARPVVLSFRIRFSGEESAVAKPPGVPRVSLPLPDWDEKNYPSPPINLSSPSDFQEQESAVPAAERDSINGR